MKIEAPLGGATEISVRDYCEDKTSKKIIIAQFYQEMQGNVVMQQILKGFSKEQIANFPVYCGANVSTSMQL